MAYDFSTVTEVQLAHGSHPSAQDGMCFMEMVAWFAGEAHSDKPRCACPVLGAYGIALNDAMPADLRDRLLKPLVPLIAGTVGTTADQKRRAEFLAMWSVTKILPISLRAAGLESHATACAAATTIPAARAAADAAARAARAAAVFEVAVEGLRQAILIGPHEGFDVMIDLKNRHASLRDLVAA